MVLWERLEYMTHVQTAGQQQVNTLQLLTNTHLHMGCFVAETVGEKYNSKEYNFDSYGGNTLT